MQEKDKRIIRNTIIQYVKILISAIVSLISTRIVLQQLGIDDYGIFSVVAGMIALFSILNGAMTVAVQRYLSYEIPLGDDAKINSIYNTSISLHIILAFIIALVCETIGLYFLRTQMVFAQNKMTDVEVVYHCVVVAMMLNVFSIPQQAALIAYEKFLYIALISIVESLLKLGASIILIFILYKKLIIYSLCYVLISFFVCWAYVLLTRRTNRTLKFQIRLDRNRVRQLMSFASWNFLGAIANVGRIQGINILLNMFFGTVINAAYGVANQVNSQLLILSSTIFQSSNSQVIQAYSIGDEKRLNSLILKTSKFAFILYYSISLFVFVEVEDLLAIWLGNVPPYCVMFVQLMILNSSIDLFSTPLMYVTQATGEIKVYFIVVSLIMLLILPISYWFLKNGYNPFVVMWVSVVVNILLLIVRSLFVVHNTNLEIKAYWKDVVIKAFLIIAISMLVYYPIHTISLCSRRLLVGGVLTPIIVLVLSYVLLLGREEKQFLHSNAKAIIRKVYANR